MNKRRDKFAALACASSGTDRPTAPPPPLKLNMFCQYIHLWMYVIPAADL